MVKKLEPKTHDEILDDTEKSNQLRDEWLDKNKPSVRIKSEPFPHILPTPTLGRE